MNKNQRVKIEYDGNGPAYNAKVTDADTGMPLMGVYRVELTIDVKSLVPTAVIYTHAPVTEVVVDAEIHEVCPYCKSGLDKDTQRSLRIEQAAQEALVHLSYLDDRGALTREEEPMLERLRKALVKDE